jgi:hypothetical protein
LHITDGATCRRICRARRALVARRCSGTLFFAVREADCGCSEQKTLRKNPALK